MKTKTEFNEKAVAAEAPGCNCKKEINIKCEIPEKALFKPFGNLKMANKLKEYSGDAIWAAVEYDEPKCFFNKKFYLKEDADKVIAELTNKLNNARALRRNRALR